MKFLVIGLGSMGKIRIRCLISGEIFRIRKIKCLFDI